MNIEEMHDIVSQSHSAIIRLGLSSYIKRSDVLKLLDRLGVDHPPEILDLFENHSGENLSGADLSHRILCGSDFSGCDLNGVNFQKADLEGAYLTGANLTNANIECCNLRDAALDGVIWGNTRVKDGHVLNAAPTIIQDETLDDWGFMIGETFVTAAYCVFWTHEEWLAETEQTIINAAPWDKERVIDIFNAYDSQIREIIE